MPINPNIALGAQPMQFQMPDPNAGMNALARALQIKGLSDQSKLHSQDLAERNALNDAYRNALGTDGQVNQNKLFQTMADRGLGSKIPALQKTFLETDEARGKVQEQARKGYALFQNTLGAHASNPNPTREGVFGSIQALVNSGSMDRGVAEKLVANMPEDPQQLRGFLQMALKTQMTPEQQLTVFAPKPTQVDNGQQITFRDTNPNSPTYGQATAGGTVQKVASPDAVMRTGAAMENARATREVAAATRDAASITDKRNAEMKIADDYRAQSKPFKEVSDAYRTISTALDQATTSPAATLAGATKFMKLLDPGSVVRESELGMALAATGVFDRAANYVNTLRRGKVLTAQQAADFKNIAGQIYGAAGKQQQMIDANYTRVANQYGLRPNMIVQDLGQNRPVPQNHSGGREASGKVDEGPSVFDQADAILRGGR